MEINSIKTDDTNLLKLIHDAANSNMEIIELLKFQKNLLKGINSAIYLFDLKKSRHTWTNGNYFKLTGFTDEEVMQQSPEWTKDNFHPSDANVYNDRLEFFMKDNGPTFTGFYRIKHKDGHWVWIYSICEVYERLMDGSAKVLLGSAMDLNSGFRTGRQLSVWYHENQQYRFEKMISSLTAREKDIVKLIACGKTCRQIAVSLFISPHTVNNHKKNILYKLNLHKATEIARLVAECGID